MAMNPVSFMKKVRREFQAKPPKGVIVLAMYEDRLKLHPFNLTNEGVRTVVLLAAANLADDVQGPEQNDPRNGGVNGKSQNIG